MKAFIKSWSTNTKDISTANSGFTQLIPINRTFEVFVYGKRNCTVIIEVQENESIKQILEELFKEEIFFEQ